MIELRTPRLLLRRPRWDDLEPIHGILSLPEAMKYWSTLPHEDLEVTRQWFPGALMAQGSPGWDEWIVEHEGRVAGYAGVWNMPEFGLILHPDFWGRGIGYEASRAIIGHVFDTHAIDAITADVDPRNAASLKLLGKLGFAESGRAERTFLIGGQWYDSIYLRLPRPR